jgi:hypothetical protein
VFPLVADKSLGEVERKLLETGFHQMLLPSLNVYASCIPVKCSKVLVYKPVMKVQDKPKRRFFPAHTLLSLTSAAYALQLQQVFYFMLRQKQMSGL